MRQASMLLLATAAVLLLVAAAAAAGSQQDPKTGWITGGQGVPDYNQDVWNQAYKLTIRNVPYNKDTATWMVWSDWNVDKLQDSSYRVPNNCSAEGFDTTPASSVPLVRLFVGFVVPLLRHC